VQFLQVRSRQEFFSGAKEALPIVLGYLPIGFAFGVLACNAGLSVLETMLMSLFVYAGSAQFIAVGLLCTGAGAGLIVTTTFLVNLRHLLMSAALLPYLRKIPVPALAALAYEITDESFALSTTILKNREPTFPFMAGLQTTAHSSWVLFSFLGALSSSLLTGIDRLGLDFALPAMFIALLVIQLRGIKTAIVGVISLSISLVIVFSLPGNWNIIIATMIAASTGVFITNDNS